MVPLAAGTHSFSAGTSNRFGITSLVAQQPDPTTTTTPLAHRTAGIEYWDAQTRTMSVSGEPAMYLVVFKNYNEGWTAKLGSRN